MSGFARNWSRIVRQRRVRAAAPDTAPVRSTGRRGDAAWFDWIAGERIAVGCLPTHAALSCAATEGVTHVVNCRARWQTRLTRDLAMEQMLLGSARVAHAPMWDLGWVQPHALWAGAALFAAAALDEDPAAGVLIHCHKGRRRSVLVAYAVLRLRGHDAEAAAALILRHRARAVLVPAYRASVERWLTADGAARNR